MTSITICFNIDLFLSLREKARDICKLNFKEAIVNCEIFEKSAVISTIVESAMMENKCGKEVVHLTRKVSRNLIVLIIKGEITRFIFFFILVELYALLFWSSMCKESGI